MSTNEIKDGNVMWPRKRIRFHEDTKLWGVNVWSSAPSPGTIKRYFYKTRAEARDASIGDSKNVVRRCAYLRG